jgi:transcriptional regulator of acetoin/glycerol metabolism
MVTTLTAEQSEQEKLKKVLRENYPDKTIQEIAKSLGIERNTFYARMRKAGIRPGKAMVGHGERIEVSKN